MSSSGEDGAKKIILARRARFVAAAVAGLGIACGKEVSSRPCLSVAYIPEGGPSAAPGSTATAEAGAEPTAPGASASDRGAPPADKPLADAGAPDGKPLSPLTPQPLPTLHPQPCLKIAPPTRGR